MSKELKARVALKHDVLSNWEKAKGFIPKEEEPFLVDDYDVPLVIGDGETPAPEVAHKPLLAPITENQIDVLFGAEKEESTLEPKNTFLDYEGLSRFIKKMPLEKGAGENAVQQVGSEAIGDYSFARGSGEAATEIGGVKEVKNIARGPASVVEGAGAETGEDGIGAHAGGSIGKITAEDDSEYRPTTANQRGAFAHGCGVVVDGKGAAGTGYVTEAIGEGASVEGKRVKVNADAGHGEGSGGEVNAYAAHKEGINGVITKNARHAHVEGADGYTEAKNSHVQNWGCKAFKNAGASHAGGEASETHEYAGFAHGIYCVSKEKGQVVVGRPNADSSDAIFIVGNGEFDLETYEPISRSNAFEIISRDGAVYLKLGETEISEKQLKALAPEPIFTIGNIKFEYVFGMTWSDFINSEYNVDGPTDEPSFRLNEFGSVQFFDYDGYYYTEIADPDTYEAISGDAFVQNKNYIFL